MNKGHHYNHLVERKLGELAGADTDQLWNVMRTILDQKMPEKKERRRFIPWLVNDKSVLLVGAASLITISAFSVFFLSIRQNSTRNLPALSHSIQDDKTIEGETGIVSQNKKKNATVHAGHPQAGKVSQQSISADPSNLMGAGITEHNDGSQIINNLSAGLKTTPNGGQEKSVDSKALSGDKQRAEVLSIVALTTSPGQATFQFENSNLLNEHSPATNFPRLNGFAGQRKKNGSSRTGMNDEKGLYAGIVSGIDLSSIHFQSLKTGVSKGLIIGYSFNKHWSVESGLLWDNKRFYDDGSTFAPPGYTPTGGVRIVGVNGKSRLYEWPINVKYVIVPEINGLFTTLGFSSYYMKHENYDYEYVQNNQPGGHNYLAYTNVSKNWFSVLNMSLGYSHKLGGVGSVRVEPYLKVPLKNLGVGNMPIMSTGLNIGFTRSLTR
jgi:hypothetical protein